MRGSDALFPNNFGDDLFTYILVAYTWQAANLPACQSVGLLSVEVAVAAVDYIAVAVGLGRQVMAAGEKRALTSVPTESVEFSCRSVSSAAPGLAAAAARQL